MTPASEIGNLVFHQCNKRGDNNAQAITGKRRHLKRNALATSCRHESKSITPLDYAFDYIALDATEIVIPPVCLENLAIFHWLLACRLGMDALYKQLYFAMLVGVLLERVADVKRLLRLYIFCQTALTKSDSIENGI